MRRANNTTNNRTNRTNRTNRKDKVVDHLGNQFDTTRAMLDYHGIYESNFDTKRKQGCSLEECLTTKKQVLHAVQCKDHLGNEYRSISAMTKAWGVNIKTYYSRLDRGWNVEQALTVNTDGSRKVRKRPMYQVPSEETKQEMKQEPKQEPSGTPIIDMNFNGNNVEITGLTGNELKYDSETKSFTVRFTLR